MISVQEAACRLGVSGSRVRAMLKTGVLEGLKIGNAWAISEASVARRIDAEARPGRPPIHKAQTFEREIPDVEEAHDLYDRAAEVLSGCYNTAFLDQARSQEEQRFWICVADFFLQQKQQRLVEEGIY